MSAKIITYGSGITAGSTAIPDNTSEALDIESTDAKDYITIDTTDGSEIVKIKAGAGPGLFFEAARVRAGAGGQPGFQLEDASATNPTVLPNFQDADTGTGWAGADQLSLIAGGTEAVQLRSGPEVHLGDYANDAGSNALVFKKSRSATTGTAAIVSDDDVLGAIEFKGADSAGTADSNFATGAKIFARVNGAPGDGDMPTELVFETTPDGSETPTTRMSIGANGVVATTSDSGGAFTFNRASGNSLDIRLDSNIAFNTNGSAHLEVMHSFKRVADFDGETLLLQNTSSTSSSSSSGGLWVNLSNTCTSSGTGNKTIASTAHGLLVGDAVSLPSGSGGAYEVFKVAAVGGANEFTTDTNLTNSISSAIGKTDGTKLEVKTGHGDTSFVVQGNGRVGVNVTSPAHPIDVAGTAGLSTGTAWTNTSDSRVKTDVQDIEGALDKINQLRPVSFKYTDDYLSVHNEIDGSKRYNSFIAQEYAEVFPDAVTSSGNLERVVTEATDDADEVREVLLEDVQQFTPHDLNMFLVRAVQELTARIATLEAGD